MPDEVNLVALVNKLNIRAGVNHHSEKKVLVPGYFSKAIRITEIRLTVFVFTSPGSPTVKFQNTFTGKNQ